VPTHDLAAVATGTFPLKTGILFLFNFGWLGHYSLRLHPSLAARLGEHLNGEVLDHHGVSAGYTG